MKRTVAIAALALALVGANVRFYTDEPDPDRDFHVVHGLVLIVPAPDRCFGVELESETNVVASAYGGLCE